MRAGPKAAPLDRPLPLSTLRKTGGPRAVASIQPFIHVPKGKGARKPFTARPWQRALIGGVFDAVADHVDVAAGADHLQQLGKVIMGEGHRVVSFA
jgi:hypothetical protein